MLTVSELVGFNSGSADLKFSSAWSVRFISVTSGGDFSGRTFVIKILPSTLSLGGTFVRVTLRAFSTDSMSIGALYVGHAATSGNAYNFDGNQVQGFFGGSASVVVPAGQALTTDPIEFGVDTSRAFLVAMDVPTCVAMPRVSGLGTKFISYYKLASPGQAADTLKATGYGSASGVVYGIRDIEVA